jgi:hypothetical protein
MSAIVSSPDFISIVTNAAVFFAAVGTVIAAIWTAVKKIKSVEGADSKTTARVLGGSIMENTTLLMWSESNRDVVEAIHLNTREMMELRFAVTSLKDVMK